MPEVVALQLVDHEIGQGGGQHGAHNALGVPVPGAWAARLTVCAIHVGPPPGLRHRGVLLLRWLLLLLLQSWWCQRQRPVHCCSWRWAGSLHLVASRLRLLGCRSSVLGPSLAQVCWAGGLGLLLWWHRALLPVLGWRGLTAAGGCVQELAQVLWHENLCQLQCARISQAKSRSKTHRRCCWMSVPNAPRCSWSVPRWAALALLFLGSCCIDDISMHTA